MSSFAYEPSEEVPSLLTFLCFFKLFFLQDNTYSENEGCGGKTYYPQGTTANSNAIFCIFSAGPLNIIVYQSVLLRSS